MSISLSLDEEQLSLLEERALAMDVDPGELASAAVADLLSRPDDDFRCAAYFILQKNRELSRRISR